MYGDVGGIHAGKVELGRLVGGYGVGRLMLVDLWLMAKGLGHTSYNLWLRVQALGFKTYN